MGATTGNQGSGNGSAMGAGVKGPGNGRNIFVPMVSPHIVAAGVATITGAGTVVVTLQGLTGDADAYSVQANGPHAVTVTAKTETASVLTSITLTGTVADSVDYVVTTVGAE
jgi:hypothetical protein